jgi:hypothetical protein
MNTTKPWENTPWEGIDLLALVQRLEALEREVDNLASYVEENGGPAIDEVRDFVDSYIESWLSDSDTISEIAARIKDMDNE